MKQINDQEMSDLYQEDFDIIPDESASQIFTDVTDVQSETTDINTSTTMSRESTVWNHFDKKPSYAPEHNVC